MQLFKNYEEKTHYDAIVIEGGLRIILENHYTTRKEAEQAIKYILHIYGKQKYKVDCYIRKKDKNGNTLLIIRIDYF